MTTTSINKEIVIIQPVETISHLPDAVTQDRVVKIGSEFRGQSVLVPFTKEEEEKWLYPHLGIDDRDPQLSQKIRNFWADVTIKVPAGGAVLDITLDGKGDPVNLMDYVHYRLAKLHSKVADDKEVGQGNTMYTAYIEDPEANKREQYEQVQFRKKAYKMFVIISEDKEKMEYVLRHLGEIGVDNLTPIEQENLLSTYVDTKPKKFLRVAQDPDLEHHAFLAELVEANILERFSQSYLFRDDTLAESKNDMIAFMKSSKNSKVVSELRAALNELKPKRRKKDKVETQKAEA